MSNDNVEVRAPAIRRVARAGATLIIMAALWDGVGAVMPVPVWWPAVSYVAAGIGAAAACVGVLMHLLMTPAAVRARGRSALQLMATGILIIAWLLRGHPEIPPDLPIIAAEFLVASVLLFARYR